MLKLRYFDDVKVVYKDGTVKVRRFNSSDIQDNEKKHQFIRKMQRNTKVSTVDWITKSKKEITIAR